MNLQQTSCLLLLKDIYRLGKLNGGRSCSHIEYRFSWDFDVVFLKGKNKVCPYFLLIDQTGSQ